MLTFTRSARVEAMSYAPMARCRTAMSQVWLAAGLVLLGFTAGPLWAAAPTSCAAAASSACYSSFESAALGGRLNYFASQEPSGVGAEATPSAALVVLHGHPRDAAKTFEAGLLAARNAGLLKNMLVVAPVFQVDGERSRKCRSPGVPVARDGDLLWTCASWIEGGSASNGQRPTSFAAMDALLGELMRAWPSLQAITVAGFSAGAQMVQHYIGFAAVPLPGSATVRYVVAAPGTWLYFDAARPQGKSDGCAHANRWKYGTDDLPPELGRSAAQARAQYAAADIAYLAGELDNGPGPGKANKILDKSCPAMAQGPDRLRRGMAYAEYDRQQLAPNRQRQLVVVPGCAHDVSCVFPSQAASAALFGTGR